MKKCKRKIYVYFVEYNMYLTLHKFCILLFIWQHVLLMYSMKSLYLYESFIHSLSLLFHSSCIVHKAFISFFHFKIWRSDKKFGIKCLIKGRFNIFLSYKDKCFGCKYIGDRRYLQSLGTKSFLKKMYMFDLIP